MKTKSVRLYGANDLRTEEFELPEIISGYYGIYQSQEIRYSKLKPEKIEIHEK